MNDADDRGRRARRQTGLSTAIQKARDRQRVSIGAAPRLQPDLPRQARKPKACCTARPIAPVAIGGTAPVHTTFQKDVMGLRLKWPISWAARDPAAIACRTRRGQHYERKNRNRSPTCRSEIEPAFTPEEREAIVRGAKAALAWRPRERPTTTPKLDPVAKRRKEADEQGRDRAELERDRREQRQQQRQQQRVAI
jgi:hypothetical protein